MINFLKEHNMPLLRGQQHHDEVLPELDVLATTRIQRERFTSAAGNGIWRGSYQLTGRKR